MNATILHEAASATRGREKTSCSWELSLSPQDRSTGWDLDAVQAQRMLSSAAVGMGHHVLPWTNPGITSAACGENNSP